MVTSIQRQRYPHTKLKKLVKFANTEAPGRVLFLASDESNDGRVRASVMADLTGIAQGKEFSQATIKRLEDAARGMTIRLHSFRMADREMFLEYTSDTFEAMTSYLTLLL